MLTRKNDVNPTDLSEKYQVALQDTKGHWVGFAIDDFVNNVKSYPLNKPPAQQRLEQMSFHLGQGVERWLPGNFSYYASKDAWRLTPGKLHSSPLWHWPKGMRDHVTNAPGSVVWKPLINNGGLAVQVVSACDYTGGTTFTPIHTWCLLRKHVNAEAVNTLGNITATYRDYTGGTVVQNGISVAGSTISDISSRWVDFTPGTTAFAAGGTSWLILRGAATDTVDNCWEVGCDPNTAGLYLPTTNWASGTAVAYSPYYHITDADTARVVWPFGFDSGFYALTSPDAGGTSQLFINGVRGRATGTQTGTTLVDTTFGSNGTATAWATDRWANAYVRIVRGAGAGQVRKVTSNTAGTMVVPAWTVTPGTVSGNESEYVVYGTPWWKEIASAFTAPVASRPAYANGIVYFPMGDAVDIRRMRLNYGTAQVHEFANEATTHNQASFLASGYISADGPVLWRGNNATTAAGTPAGSKVSVARANLSGLAWGTDLTFKSSILMGDNTQSITNLHVHTNKLYCFKEDQLFAVENDIPVQVKAGIDSYPSRRNGVGIATGTDTQLYVGLRHDLFMIAGAQIVSTGLQRDAGVQSGLSGYVADIEAVNAWNFFALDAGDGGTSSVWIYAVDTQTHGELIRAFASGRRIRSVKWQPCENTNPILWYESGGELLYQKFPVYDVRPLNDSTMEYMWECVLETSTIDLLSVDPKYFSNLLAVSKNMADEETDYSGHDIFVEYQLDNDVGTSSWTSLGRLSRSPLAALAIEKGSRRMIRLRFRLFTPSATVPTILERFGLTVAARTPIYHGYDILTNLDDSDEEQKAEDVIKWINQKAVTAEKLKMTSNNPLYHNKTVLLQSEPAKSIEEYDADVADVSGKMVVRLEEIA